MAFNNQVQGGASFFKILLRDSIDRLPLPPAFAKKYLETGSLKNQMVVLKIKSGVKGRVKYSKIKDNYYFMDGWLKFMKNNRLQMGVFLVFWLMSPSPTPVFQVSVYEPNGCLKNPTTSDDAGPSNRKTPFVKAETSDNDLFENVQQKMTRVVYKSYSKFMRMKTSFVKDTGMNGYRTVRLRNDDGKIWKVKVRKCTYVSEQVTMLARGWYDFRKDNKIEIGDTCEFYHVKGNLLHVRKGTCVA